MTASAPCYPIMYLPSGNWRDLFGCWSDCYLLCSESRGSFLGRTQLFLKTNPAPKGMTCQVQPMTGVELYTHFSIFCTSGKQVCLISHSKTHKRIHIQTYRSKLSKSNYLFDPECCSRWVLFKVFYMQTISNYFLIQEISLKSSLTHFIFVHFVCF